MEGKRLHVELAVGKHPLHVAHCEIVDVVRWNPVAGIPPARHELPKVVAIWNDDDGQPAIAKGRYGIGQQALGIENMLEHIVDDDRVDRTVERVRSTEEMLAYVEAVCAAEPGIIVNSFWFSSAHCLWRDVAARPALPQSDLFSHVPHR